MIAVIGSRGGVGATTIATTLAAIFAGEHEMPTALVDMDAQFGSVALGLDLEPSRGLRDALDKPERIDSLYLERVMMKAASNLSILSAEEPLSEMIAPHASAGELLFKTLREKFPMTIVDLPRQVSPLTRYVMGQADHVVLVCEPSILSLRDALRLKDLLVENLKRPVPIVLVNREGLAARQEPTRAEFAKHLGLSPSYYLPFISDVIGAVARGETVLGDAKLAGVAAPLRKLAGELSSKPGATKAAKPAGKLGGLLKGRK